MNTAIKLVLAVLIFGSCMEINANSMPVNKNYAKILHIAQDFSIDNFDNKSWANAKEILIDKYWSGKKAPVGRQFKVRLLWSDTALYIRFDAKQAEPLIISDLPNLKTKTVGLWNRDVCEIFMAPDSKQPRKYFEFEIAPNGEWLDLFIDFTGAQRKTDWDYRSGMQSFTKIENDKVLKAMKIEWKAFGRTPKAGDVWLGNLFRCVGKDPGRGYLAWSSTETKEPNFHVPEKFGEFEFVKTKR